MGAVNAAHLGYPVNFEGRDRFANDLALNRLGEAFNYAGIKTQQFFPEPIAVADFAIRNSRKVG